MHACSHPAPAERWLFFNLASMSGESKHGPSSDATAVGRAALHKQRDMLYENEPPTTDAEKHADWERALREVEAHIEAEEVGNALA